MSLFTKTGPWLAASLMTVAAVFGQNSKCAPNQKNMDQGHDMMSQMMPGYNASSRIEVRGSWDIYASGAFTYWQPMQDNMELGVVSNTTDPASNTLNGNVVNPHFAYKPGFQVALGMDFDHDGWDSMVQYTWFRGKGSTTTSLDSVEAPGTQLFPSRTVPSAATTGYYHGSQSWKLHMDLLDWQVARSYYVGTKLSFRPFMAARAAWIRQNLSVSYTDPAAADTPALASSVANQAHSWAVGPRTGIATDWLIGEGFRMFGNGGADILFTQYTKLSSKALTGTVVHDVVQRKLNTIRTHLDLEFGFGWGSYFDNNNWHVDLMAGYGFQVFFDQNMFRQFLGSSTANTAHGISPNGNLYMHGLTATARFDF